MKREELKKLQELSIAELNTEVKKREAELMDSTMKKELAQLKNVRQGKSIRHDIARIKSIISMKAKVATNRE
jgi:ribosomal protein L29